MSDLQKITLTVKNFNLEASGEFDALFKLVRCEDEDGNALHFKDVLMLDYLSRHGAMVTEKPRTWYYKNIGKKSIIVVAVGKLDGKIEYDLDHMHLAVRSSLFKGILVSLGAIPAGIIIGTATFGFGLLFIPVALFYGYKHIFKIPAMLRRKTLVNDLALHGVVVR